MTLYKHYFKVWRIGLALLVALIPLLSMQVTFAQTIPAGDPNIVKTWERTDQPVASGQIGRSWMWGPKYFFSGYEDYQGATNNKRQVFYFDKSRMEINNVNGDRSSKWFVTNGLLVKELISGKRATSDNTTISYLPAQVPIAGDPTANPAPTYASFYGVASMTPGQYPAINRVGQKAQLTLEANGNVGEDFSLAYDVRYANYDPTFGHNVPKPFWDYMNSNGKVLVNGALVDGPVVDWTYSMGYPISEAYWVQATVGGVTKSVLVQAFERRVLTYTPTNTPDWQVEMGNVGQHYYRWRYETPIQNCTTAPVRGFGRVWANNPSVQARIGCPYDYNGGEQATKTAVLNFEHGKMFFVDSTATPGYYPYNGWKKAIYVLFDDGTFATVQDTWDSSQPVKQGLTPPAGLYEPERGFGKVWFNGTGLRIRERLGWATQPIEKSGDGAVQDFWGGNMHWLGATNQIVVLYRYYGQISVWELYNDDFKG